MKELQNLIYDFLDDVKIFKSAETWKYYYFHLKSSFRFFSCVEDLNSQKIKQYVIFLKDNGLSNKTINKKILALKTMCKYFNIDVKELFDFPKLREVQKKPHYLSEKDIIKLLDYIKNSNMKNKNKAIVLLFLFTGIRLNELVNIKRSNIDLQRRIIKLEETKTRNERYVPYRPILDEYLKNYLMSCVEEKPFYFSKRTIQAIFERICQKLNFSQISPHTLRHTFATYLCSKNFNLEKLRILLGHSNLRTTQLYTHLDFESIQDEYNCKSIF